MPVVAVSKFRYSVKVARKVDATKIDIKYSMAASIMYISRERFKTCSFTIHHPRTVYHSAGKMSREMPTKIPRPLAKRDVLWYTLEKGFVSVREDV